MWLVFNTLLRQMKRRKIKKVHVFYTNQLSYWCKILCKEPLQRTDNVQYLIAQAKTVRLLRHSAIHNLVALYHALIYRGCNLPLQVHG